MQRVIQVKTYWRAHLYEPQREEGLAVVVGAGTSHISRVVIPAEVDPTQISSLIVLYFRMAAEHGIGAAEYVVLPNM